MTVGRMATAYDHPISSPLECLQNEKGVDTARAGEADYAHVRGHGEAARSGKISARIGAPIANERDNAGFERIRSFNALR